MTKKGDFSHSYARLISEPERGAANNKWGTSMSSICIQCVPAWINVYVIGVTQSKLRTRKTKKYLDLNTKMTITHRYKEIEFQL